MIASLPALAGFLAGGAAWGASIGMLARVTDTRRMAIAGLFGFGPSTIILAVDLNFVEGNSGMGVFNQIPIHRLFTLSFVSAAFLIAGTSAWGIEIGLKDRTLARSLFIVVWLSGGVAFLSVNLGMEALGWVVFVPGAASHATMVNVMSLGNLSPALVGGGVLGSYMHGITNKQVNNRIIRVVFLELLNLC
jgi:hypothetical protein